MEEDLAQEQPLIEDLESAIPADTAKQSAPSLSSEEPNVAFPSTHPSDEDPFAPLDYDEQISAQVPASQPSLPENDPPVLELETANVQVSAQVSGASQEQETEQVDGQVEEEENTQGGDSSVPLIPQGDAQDDESSHKRSLESSSDTMKRVRTVASSGPDKVELGV